MVDSFKKIYKLKPNVDYMPGFGVLSDIDKPIIAIHCIINPTEEISIKTIEGQVIIFPIGSLVQGAIYPYEIRQVDEHGSLCLYGISK